MKTKDFSALPSAKVHFVEPMYALAVQKLPQGQEWLYEVKFDGYRCLAGRDSTGVTAAPIGMSESLAANTKLVRVAKEFGFEDIVAKRKDSVYESGKRTGAWVKYRVNRVRSLSSADTRQEIRLMR